MRIRRRGTATNRGWSEVSFRKLNISWNDVEKSIVLKTARVKDFTTESNHDYEIFISMKEITWVFNFVGERVVSRAPEIVEEAMASSLRGLIRILSTVSGLAKKEEDCR